MPCFGNRDDHCCWVAGKPCQYLEEDTVEGRRWACGLMVELGDWEKVIASDRYKKNVAPIFEPLGMNCRDWPDGDAANSGTCVECGVNT